MAKLSIIVPYIDEYPMIHFTVCGLRCELEQSNIDWEIIAIANKNTDKGYKKICDIAKPHKRITSLKYDEKLSHWNAKNFGIQHSSGDVLFFIDSHCLLAKDSLINMYKYYTEHEEELHGTLHLPILYMSELNGRELEYKLVANITDDKKMVGGNNKNSPHNLHYNFTRIRNRNVHRISCTSTCGMMISRKLLVDELGMWPKALGIYGGGENFINFTLAVMGYHINVFSSPNSLHHFAEKRNYSWHYDCWIKNRIVAAYMNGGKKWAKIYALNAKGRRTVLERMYNEVLEECSEHREFIKPKIKTTPQEWVEREVREGRSIGVYR